MRTLAARVAALVVAAALLSSLVTASVLWRAAAVNRRQDAVDALARDARTLSAVVGVGNGAAVAVRRAQAASGVVSVVVRPRDSPAALPAPLLLPDLAAARRGHAFDGLRRYDGQRWAVAGVLAGKNGAVVLVAEPVDRALSLTRAQRRQVVLGGLAGLIAGAAAGLLLVRVATRPLRGVAASARRLSRGERGVVVPTGGPTEVAEVAVALEGLSRALEDGEARQQAFLAAVSHELRTPLTAVTGYAELIADGSLPAQEVPAAAQVIHAEAARAARRVEDLLTLARLEGDDFPLTIDDVDAGEVVRAAGRAWAPRAVTAGVVLRVEAPDAGAGPVLRTDGERLRQIVDALCDNALRVLPAGAALVVAARADGAGVVVVEVRDGGPGLDDADLAVAFERGLLTERYRGRRRVGSGLGLALVGGLARRLGAQAAATRAPEGGLAVSVRFPPSVAR